MDIRKFKDTHIEYSPGVIWDWCAKPTAEEIDEKLFRFSQMGISKVYLRPSKGLVLPYLSPDYFELVRTAARRCGKYGMHLFVCDENSSASGNGGGEITSVSDYRLKDILFIDKKEIEKTDVVLSEENEKALILRDMSKMRASGRAALSDITDAFVTECFTDAVYEKYFKECKRFLGMEISGFLTTVNIPENALVYSQNALKKTGKEITADITENGKKEYMAAVSQCIGENFTGIIKGKCKDNSLDILVNVQGDRAVSRQLQYLKADRISVCLDSENTDIIQLKLAQTISSQFEKPMDIRLLLPSFSPCSYRYNTGAFASSFGAHNVLYDSVAYSLSDRRKYEKHTSTLSPFTEKTVSDKLSRLCFAGANTISDANILIIYDPFKDDLYNNISKKLLNEGISFHAVEECFFEKEASVNEERITIGKCEYNTVITQRQDLLKNFRGAVIESDEDYDYNTLQNSKNLSLTADKEVYISRRKNGNDEYIFLTAQKEDTAITANIADKKLFAADSSNGEIYRIPAEENVCKFKLKAGKTAILIHSDRLSEDYAPPYTDDIEFAPSSKECDILFALASAEENMLPLKNVNACFGRKAFRENSIDNLHKEFYSLADGETVKVKYPFNADKSAIGQVKAFIENAENLEFVQFNGKQLTGFIPSEKDPRFKGVDITDLIASGKNTLAVEYKKSNNYTPLYASFTPSHYYSYNVTSFEPVYLHGDFDVVLDGIGRLDSYENDITKTGMQYYYGALTYAAKLPEKDLNGKILAIYGDFDICRIKIGKRVVTFFSETPMLEMFNLDCGVVAEITLYNTPYNLLRTASEEVKSFGLNRIELCKFEY